MPSKVEPIKLITKDDLKLSGYHLPSTKTMLVKRINKQIERFNKYIGPWLAILKKDNILKESKNRVKNHFQYTKMDSKKQQLFNYVLEEEIKEVSPLVEKGIKEVSSIPDDFKTRYLNEWLTNKKAVERDEKLSSLLNYGINTWKNQINKFIFIEVIDKPLNNLKEKAKTSKIKLRKIACDVKEKIKPSKEFFDKMAQLGCIDLKSINEIDKISSWINQLSMLDTDINKPLPSSESIDVAYGYIWLTNMCGISNYQRPQPSNEAQQLSAYCSLKSPHIEISSNKIELLLHLSKSCPEPEYFSAYKEIISKQNQLLSKKLTSITQEKVSCSTWSTYKNNKKFVHLFNNFIDALKSKSYSTQEDVSTLMDFLIDNTFQIKKDFDVPGVISRPWSEPKLRRIIFRLCTVDSISSEFDKNAKKNQKKLEEFLGIEEERRRKIEVENKQKRKEMYNIIEPECTEMLNKDIYNSSDLMKMKARCICLSIERKLRDEIIYGKRDSITSQEIKSMWKEIAEYMENRQPEEERRKIENWGNQQRNNTGQRK